MPGFNLRDYVPVAERVNAAKGEIAHVQTDPPAMLTDVLGFVRVTITLGDGRSSTGLAQFRLEGAKGAQATNPLEDAETSAVGRALAFLGYGSSRAIANRDDMARAQQTVPAPRLVQPEVSRMDRAEQKFWATFEGPLGGRQWSRIIELLGPTGEPTSVEEWGDLFRAVGAALDAESEAAA